MTPSSGSSSLPLSFFLPSRCPPRAFHANVPSLPPRRDRSGKLVRPQLVRLIETPDHRLYNDGTPSAADRLHFTSPMDFTGVPVDVLYARTRDDTATLTPMK